MLTRIRPRKVYALARRDLPAPLDVVNLITTARFDRYRWYGLLVVPALLAAGGRVRWMGRCARTVHGPRQADKLLVVRYPSHRRFLAMTLNPYYLAINRLREAGVSRFEASFTHASHTDPLLGRRRTLVGVHFGGDALAAVRDVVAPVAGELVYATAAVASVDVLDPPRPTDPNALSFGGLALFALADGVDDGALAALVPDLEAAAGEVALHVYEREDPSVYRPSLRGGAREAVGA